eukprot:scpid38829/ scgid1803/ 
MRHTFIRHQNYICEVVSLTNFIVHTRTHILVHTCNTHTCAHPHARTHTLKSKPLTLPSSAENYSNGDAVHYNRITSSSARADALNCTHIMTKPAAVLREKNGFPNGTMQSRSGRIEDCVGLLRHHHVSGGLVTIGDIKYCYSSTCAAAVVAGEPHGGAGGAILDTMLMPSMACDTLSGRPSSGYSGTVCRQ